MSTDEAAAEWVGIGNRVRKARTDAHMSVRELARRVDVSASHVSQVERGLASFSVRALYNVVSVLGISMDSLFENGAASELPEDNADAPVTEEALTGPLDEARLVQRAHTRPTIPLPGGTRWERLTPMPEKGAEFIEVIYPPGSPASRDPQDFIRHSSREYGLVVRGSLTVQVGFDRTVLGEGDSIAFDSQQPHRFWNETPAEVRAVWFIWDDAHAADSSADEPTRGH